MTGMNGSARPLRVALADGRGPVRAGLRERLERLGVVVALEAEEAQGLLDALQLQPVDVVLAGTGLAGVDGRAAARELHAAGEHTPVLLLGGRDDPIRPPPAGEPQVYGMVAIDATPEDLYQALVHVLALRASRAQVAGGLASPDHGNRDDARPAGGFSARELAILRLLAGGSSDQDIARSLHLAEGTVKSSIASILDQLGSRDRTRAVLKAITLRVI